MTTVLIDAYALSEASGQRGIGTYLRRMIGGLAAEQDLAVKLLAADHTTSARGAEAVAIRRRAPRRLRSLEHDLLLPIDLRRVACDVFHSPAQHPPRHSPVPWVHTLHDLTPLSWPHRMHERERRRWKRLGPRLRDAAAVVAVSRFSADEGIRLLGLDSAKVVVIPEGVDPAIFYPSAQARAQEPFLLHVGSWGPHKGFPDALEVIAIVAELGLPHRLVMAGPNDAWQLEQIRTAVNASARPDRVRIAGYLPDLASTYRHADALLMTSRCEGFGLPALEAMACGTPVVAFDNSALPEVIGEGGVLVPDGDTRAMAKAVHRLLVDPETRAELSELALARSRRFRWEATVSAHAELLRAVAG